jgi:cytochrome c oxidase assembly protein subunit 15
VFLAGIVAQIGIVVTGGLVRLTSSGLGCPSWPRCSDDSLVPREATGYHQYVEFGNRMLTSVVGIVALACVIAAWRHRPRRRSLVLLASVQLAGVAAQAVLGGITVLTGLHPATVAAHFLVSMTLVGFAVALYERSAEGDGLPVPLVRREARVLGYVLLASVTAVLIVGTIVTGSGPHSGDSDEVARFGLDPRTVAWVHADLVWLFMGLVVGMVILLQATDAPSTARHRALVVLGLGLAQGGIGYFQYWAGLPVPAVALHMLGASLLLVSVVRLIYSLRTRPVADIEAGHSATNPAEYQPR